MPSPEGREEARGRRPRRFVVLLAVTVFGALVVAIGLVQRHTQDRPSTAGSGYCLVFRDPDKTVDIVESAIAGRPVSPYLSLDALRGGAGFVSSPSVADEAAPDDRDAADVALSALREAIASGDAGPLHGARVRDAVEYLEGRSKVVCPS